jgi:5-methylcytosine-specific restriction endonuclease McrA
MAQRNFKPRHLKSPGTARKFNGRKHIDDMYDDAWNRYRQRFLAINPNCYACGKKAIVVDHLIPHQGDEKLFLKLDNHIPLCVRDHNTVTSLFDRKYVAGNPVTDKIKWLNDRRLHCENTIRVKVLASYE